MKRFSLVVLFLSLAGLGQTIVAQDTSPASQSAIGDAASKFKLPYQLTQPDATFELPPILVEISGLSLSDCSQRLCAIQDENGIVFRINKTDGTVEERFEFWKNGDYEGIEMVGDRIYVVKSTGTVYEIINWGTAQQSVNKFNTFLKKENDVEGLAYDAKNHALLIACKGIPATGESFEVARLKKVIYSFDLNKKELDFTPRFEISLTDIHSFLNTCPLEKNIEKLISFFKPDQNLTFSPSALAIHPISGNIYILSSSKKIIIVLNARGEIIHIDRLDKKIHRQPEGLAFDKDGTLYLSNEGKKGKACIHRFAFHQ
ncbi:MAG: SdiA-regulated domain-containing protein [Bacteroidota bacterium]